MKTKQFTRVLLGVALVFGLAAGQAQAISMSYTVSGTFNDGGGLSGTIDIDSLLNNPVTAWNLTTTTGSSILPGYTYNNSNSIALINTISQTTTFSGIPWLANTSLTLAGYSPTLNNPGPYKIGTVTERGQLFGFSATRTGSGTMRNVINPEPATILLFGTGLVGLAAWRYRKNKSA